MRTLLLSVAGCLWYYGTNVHGEPRAVNDRDPDKYVLRLKDDSEHLRIRNDQNPLPDPGIEGDFKKRSDYAATLVHRGDAKKAVKILEEIERGHPGEYVVAANLGTAHELSGNDEEALHWIREGLKRNQDSHFGTEWLHILILESKIALAKDPKWLETHTVLGVDFGKDLLPVAPVAWSAREVMYEKRHALQYQLHERMSFVKAPDPVVGDLLADLGHLAALEMSIEHAVAIYGVALEYKTPQAELVTRRRDHLQKQAEESRLRRERWERLKSLMAYGGVIAAIGLAVAVYYWVRRGRA
jgi:tetratricopeptide (TPR) repeat protein